MLRASGARAGAPEPWWIEYPKSFFPVLLIVFLLRSFLAEPFKIPSSSMRPTLEVGDFILVNKFAYGIRLPIVEQKIIPLGDPQRGDVVVFRYPVNPSQDFIKRVVGVGGDEVVYRDKQLDGQRQAAGRSGGRHLQLPRGPALRDHRARSRATDAGAGAATTHDRCATRRRRPCTRRTCGRFRGARTATTMIAGSSAGCRPGHYFMMGDNRDNSDDSRYWGFVPDDHIRGRAFFIWFNWDDISSLAFKRVGSGHPIDGRAAAMTHRTRQRGLSIIGFLFVAAVVLIVVAMVGFRVVPAVHRVLLGAEGARPDSLRDVRDPDTIADVRRASTKRADAGYIESVRAERHRDHQATATRSPPRVEWTRKLHLVGNVSLLLEFEASATR